MSDIFHEVEEEVRRERFEKFWKQYGDYLIAGFALLIIALAGWKLFERYEDNKRLEASETLIAAQQLADNNDFTKATAQFAIVAKDAPDGYAKMARMSQAGVLLASGQRSEAIAIFKAIAAEDDGGVIGKVALIRAGWALSDSAPPSEVATLLAPLTDPASTWRHAAREVVAYSQFHAGQYKEAQVQFQTIADDKDAPEAMRRRTAAMAAFLKNGGLANYGTVPPPAPPPPLTPGTVVSPGTETTVVTGTPPQ